MLSIQSQVPLAPLTTFKLGGPAEYFVRVTTAHQLVEALEHARRQELPVFLMAGGSNLLVSDQGVRGLVIEIANTSFRIQDRHVWADAGVPLLTLVQAVAQAGLAGMERLAGIPGSLGGALRGNAGAFGMEIKDVVLSVKAYDRRQGVVRSFQRADCQFGYRSSIFKKRSDLVILSAELELTLGDRAELERMNRVTMEQREAKHPQTARCAGSFFMNPEVTDSKLLEEFERDTGTPSKDGKLPAGWLIDHVGLRGKRIGGAQVSAQHPNYFVNTGQATADDVVMLASLVKQRVRSELGVELREEVQMVGF